MKNGFIAGVLLLAVIVPAQAQTFKKTAVEVIKEGMKEAGFGKVASQAVSARMTRAAGKTFGKDIMEQSATLQQVEASLDDLLKKDLLASFHAAETERDIRHSLVEVIDPRSGHTKVTGFMFTDEREGRPVLWAALPYHAVGVKGNRVWLKISQLNGSRLTHETEVVVAGRGRRAGLDMALAQLPPKLISQVKPLRWAQTDIIPADVLTSYGFNASFGEKRTFNKVENRRVLSTGGYQVITTFNYGRFDASGACGSPLLNANGEVVGMHSGSYMGRLSFAVNHQGAQDLLKAHYEGHAYQPVMLNGHEIGRTDVTERIDEIQIIRRGRFLKVFDAEKYEGAFDLKHLDELVKPEPGDQVKLYISDTWGHIRYLEYRP